MNSKILKELTQAIAKARWRISGNHIDKLAVEATPSEHIAKEVIDMLSREMPENRPPANGSRYWIADLHLGHEKIAGVRGYASVEEHDEAISKAIRVLRPGDTLWVLGDISSGHPERERRALEILQRLKRLGGFYLHLIAGNHDSVSSVHRNGYKKQAEWLEVFDSVQQFGWVRLAGVKVLMSHYPYARMGDGPGRDTDRYGEYRLRETGLPLIHGHTHQSTPHPYWNRSYCVSWDSHYRPVPESDLNEWIELNKSVKLI